MKKSELKKHLVEALTPDEAAKVEPKYKETYAAMIRGKGPLKLKKYDNPDKVVRGRVVNTIKNESLKLAEKLGKDADLGDHIEDFTKSDAKQFQGKSKKKIRQMATAAFLNKEEQKLDEIDAIMEEDELTKSEKNKLKKVSSQLKKSVKAHDKQSKTIDKIVSETGQETSKENMEGYKKGNMDKNRLEEFVKAALMGPINETLDDKVYDLVDRMLDAMGGSDNLLKELIRAMSTKDAMFYLSAIARDYGMFDDAEEISEKKFPDLNDDGKITKADVLIGRGVKLKEEEEDEKEFVAINAIIADLNDKVPQFKTIDTPDEYLALLDRIVTILVKESPSFVGSGRFITANVEFYNRRKDYNAKAKAQGETNVEINEVDSGYLRITDKIRQAGKKAKGNVASFLEEFNKLTSNAFKSDKLRDLVLSLAVSDNQLKDVDIKNIELAEDKVKGSNVRKKKSGSGYEVLSGKTGKPLNKTFKSKKSARDFIKAYHANISERILKELRK